MNGLPNLAIAVIELHLASSDVELNKMSFACELEAMCAGKSRSHLEQIGHGIGLSASSVRDVLDNWETRATAIFEAHKLLKALIPIEGSVYQIAAIASQNSEPAERDYENG